MFAPFSNCLKQHLGIQFPQILFWWGICGMLDKPVWSMEDQPSNFQYLKDKRHLKAKVQGLPQWCNIIVIGPGANNFLWHLALFLSLVAFLSLLSLLFYSLYCSLQHRTLISKSIPHVNPYHLLLLALSFIQKLALVILYYWLFKYCT